MPCDYKKYPGNWNSEIRPRILARAGDCCERCGVPNYAIGYRVPGGAWVDIEQSFAGDMHAEDAKEQGYKIIKIVLTVAHIHNPDPMDCRDENLEALCQRCHNLLDGPMRRANATATRAQKKNQQTLFNA